MKYKAKPVVVEAVQVTAAFAYVPEFGEEPVTANPGDWVVTYADSRQRVYTATAFAAEFELDVPAREDNIERRVREMLAVVAPVGSDNTPELRAKVKAEVANIITEELAAQGVTGPHAVVLSNLLAVSMNMRFKGHDESPPAV